jgi:hypothetical protein
MRQRVSRRAVLSSPASKEINVTTKIYSEMLAADRTDDLPILTDGELDRVVGGRDTTKIHVSEIVVTKKMDSASPLLLN